MGSTGSGYSIHNQLSLLPSFTYVHGAHNIHTGLDNREYQISTKQGSGGLSISSSNNWTQAANNNTSDANSGLSVASFLLDNGYVTGGSVAQPAQVFESYHYYGAFIQDNYKAAKNLTLNIGLRYDFPSQAVDRYDRYTNTFLPGVTNPVSSYAASHGYAGGAVNGVLTFSGANAGSRIQIPRAWYMFEPRFGAAYQLDKNTVLRGGFGVA